MLELKQKDQVILFKHKETNYKVSRRFQGFLFLFRKETHKSTE
jgi:hypothetical protein